MRSKILRVILGSLLVLGVVSAAALLAMSVTGTEIRAQARERVAGLPDLTAEPHVQAYNQYNLIRFHVIANSDSDRDQALKRRVRDLIVRRMTPEFTNNQSLSEARQTAQAHLEEIREIAEKEVSAWGEQYPIKVQLGKFDFPVKTYGKLTLPAGNYEAVRVVIGEGQGANWWCVLFPPLCFVDVSRVTASVEQQQEEEDEAVVFGPPEAPDNGIINPPVTDRQIAGNIATENVKIRFRFLEFFERW